MVDGFKNLESENNNIQSILRDLEFLLLYYVENALFVFLFSRPSVGAGACCGIGSGFYPLRRNSFG